MKKTNLIIVALLGLTISVASAIGGPGQTHFLFFKIKSAPKQVTDLKNKVVNIFQNGLLNPEVKITPGSDHLNVSTNTPEEDLVFKIYKPDGTTPMAQGQIINGQGSLSLADLPSGTYIARTSLRSGGIVNVQQIQLMR